MTPELEFVERLGTYTGVDTGGRIWVICRCFTGWRLEFRDHGDLDPTYAGIHATLGAAQHEAGRVTGRSSRRPPPDPGSG
jgi:hypothetical protein